MQAAVFFIDFKARDISGTSDIHVFLIRNQFISNLVLDTQKIKELLELQRKS